MKKKVTEYILLIAIQLIIVQINYHVDGFVFIVMD